MQGKIIVSIGFALWSYGLFGQEEVDIKSGFIQDSISIGEKVDYWITATYDPKTEVLFPDSNFNFSPYEYLDKSFWPTILREGNAFDSAVYSLQSFEIDDVQYLQLPVSQFNQGDTTEHLSPIDSISFRNLVVYASDTTSMRVNTNYLQVNRLVNYPLIWIIIGSLVVLTLAVFLIFGNRIRRALLIRKMKRDYIRFSEKLTEYIRDIRNSPNHEKAEEAVSNWKKYLEGLESVPFSKLTTKEILALDNTTELSEALRNIDRSIYGQLETEDLYKAFQSIEDYTQHRYHRKLEDIRDGK